MKIHRKLPSAAGFTLIELLVALMILGVLLAFGVPLVLKTVHTAKMSSAGFDCNSLVRRAKSEAIRKNSPVVLRYDPLTDPDPLDGIENGKLVAFVDVHGPEPDNVPPDPPDGVFNPRNDGRPFTETDHELNRCSLPGGVGWGGPDAAPSMIEGFTLVGTESVAIFLPDGSIQNIGAYRFGDERGNYLQIEVAPSATARVTLKKWDETGDQWREQEENGQKWTWY